MGIYRIVLSLRIVGLAAAALAAVALTSAALTSAAAQTPSQTRAASAGAASVGYLEGTLQGTHFKAVQFPYGARARSMFIVLPESGASMARFAEALGSRELTDIQAGLRQSRANIALPRSAGSGDVESPALDDVVKALGLGFTVCHSAGDLSLFQPAADRTCLRDESRLNRPVFYAVEDETTGELLSVGILVDSNG